MIHLHTRSSYSLLESPIRLEELVKKAVEEKKDSIVLTDHKTMFGTMEFIKLCQKYHLKPIIGLEFEISINQEKIGLIALAKNNEGFYNLIKLSTILSTRALNLDEIYPYLENTIVLTAGINDSLEKYLELDRYDEGINCLKELASHIQDFYLSICMNDSNFHQKLNQKLKEMAETLSIPTTALSRIYYLKKEEVENLRILKAIEKQTTVSDQTLDVEYNRFWRTDEEMKTLYSEEDLVRSQFIADQCNIDLEHFNKSQLPVFVNKLNVDSKTYLIKLCKAGLLKRLNNKLDSTYVRRLEYELSVIAHMGFTDYFLIVYDMIRFARTQDILVGPGRGSAAGSLVAYCLGITHIDPIKNDLLFERFLNPERISMPDIDTDFPDDRRNEILDYLQQRYGSNHVSQIITFSALKAKQVIRDVGKVYGYSNLEIDRINKLIPNTNIKMSLKELWNENINFRQLIQSDPKYLKLYQKAVDLEGLPRHTSQHAAGIVLSQKDILTICPLYYVDDSIHVTQYTMQYLEELGLIKMDVLALKNLTTIANVLKDIQEKEHKTIDIFRLDLNDKKTFDLLSSADTVGVFQFESEGIKNLLKKIRPRTFSDIAVTLALYRPGPMENIPLYLHQRANPASIHYLHPLLEPILKETYGVMIYQEQIMKIAQVIGQMSLSQADSLRKAMSKKNRVLMDSYKKIFIDGAISQKIDRKDAQEIFATMEHFADYGFNKSHSYAYASTAYAMAYLKANYPLYFYRNLLNSVIGSETKSAEYIFECTKRNIRILPCSIMDSNLEYTIEKDALRMPLQVLKGIGKNICEKILTERAKKPFTDLFECVARLIAIKINENILTVLINAGALDAFGYSRMTLRENLRRIISYANIVKIDDGDIHFDFSIASKPNLLNYEDRPLEKAKNEKLVYGFYISQHPIEAIRAKYFTDIRPLADLKKHIGYIRVLGRINRVKTHRTKKGDLMCFLSLEDESQFIDVAIMPALYQKEKERLKVNQILLIEGKKDREDSILANRIKMININ